MGVFVVVPNSVSEFIESKLVEAFLAHPDQFWPTTYTWKELRRQLLLYFNEHGELPDISVYRK